MRARREEGLEGYNTYILLIRAVKLYYVSTRIKEGEEITNSQQENGHGNQVGAASSSSSWWGGGIAWAVWVVRAISGKKMTLPTHQGGEESLGGEGGGLGWNAGAVSTSVRARGPWSNPSKNAIIFLPYKARNLAITSAVNLSWWLVVM